jgi:hypothetical protein
LKTPNEQKGLSMKPNISLAILRTSFVFLLVMPALFFGCSGKMSVEEARQVTISMGDQSVTE